MRTLFMLFYGRNIRFICFIVKNKWIRLCGIFIRDEIMISIIHCKQNFTLYRTGIGGN